MTDLTDTLAERSVERELELDGRRREKAEEMRRIVAAAYRVIERTNNVDPTLRELLAEAGLATQGFYRHFRSKDELLLLLLDDGCARLAGYLDHRMATADGPADALSAWVTGVLAQAADAEAAARTRPFVAHQDHLAEQFPAEHQATVDRLVDQVVAVLESTGVDADRAGADARAVYHLTFGVLGAHLMARTAPDSDEVAHLVGFVMRALEL
jgi:AcrR family transcriptional regulator